MRANHEQTVCEWMGVAPSPPPPGSKVGLAIGTLGTGAMHGRREAPTDTTNGWYVWCGDEHPKAADAFSFLELEYMSEYIPQAVEYLDLPPGFRFLIDGTHHDAWFDSRLV